MFESFAHFHGQIAIITEDGVSLSYEELDQLIEKFSANFSFGRGVALIECENSLNSIVAYLSALRAKCPAFLIASGQPDVSQNLLTQFAALYHINTRSNKITTYEETATDRLHSDLAVILSTSGSTGTAKSIRLSYRALEANAKSIVEYLSIDSTDRAPTTLPMQYSYGLSVINSHLLAGGSLVLTEKSVADREFWRLFDKYGCTSFAGVPHSYALIEKSGVKTAERTTLRYATQAGGRLEPNRVKSLAEQSQREGWRFFVMYGQTEATARMAYLPPEQALENPHCIGVPIPGGTFRLVDNHGVDLEGVDETGELVYTGDNVMMGYALGAEDLARGYELTELRTGDLACRTSNDLFQIVGRKKRFVKLYGLRISLDEVDGWLLDHGYSAVSTRCNDALWILTTTANDAPVIRDAIANWLILPPTAINVGFIEAIPRKANGKVDFSQVTQLAEQEAKKLEAATAHPAQKSKNNTVREIFASHFPNQEINSQSSFTSLGGTSLDYIEMMLALEKCVGDLPQNWYELSLLELEKKQTGKSFFQSVETQILLRSLAIVMIVIGHLTSFHYGGTGAVLLLMIAGFNFSRFQLPNILSTGSSRPILELVSIIVLPSIAYLLLLQSVFNSLHLPSLLLFSNLIEANANGGFSLWFIEVYVQILLILALLISFIPKERISSARQRPVASWLIIISILLYVLLPIAWDTTYLFNRVPHMLFWLFACGIGAQTLKSLPAKWMLSAAFMMAVYLKYGIDTPYKLLIYGGSLLIWLPRVKIPTILRQPIYQLANASLFIYLSHFQFNSLSEKIFGDQEWIAVVVALIGGVVTWKIYLACLPHFMKILSRRLSYKFNN